MDVALQNQIVIAVRKFLLSPLVDQVTLFGQVSALVILQHIFTSYGAVYGIDLNKKALEMMETYDPTEALSRLGAENLRVQEGR